MVEALQAHLGALEDEIQATAIPGGCKQSAAWCIGQLPPLYPCSVRLTRAATATTYLAFSSAC